MSAPAYRLLAIVVLGFHLVWIVWVMGGWLLSRRRPLVRGLHILSLVYSILIETSPWPCPLTILEQGLESRAGIEPYRASFLVHYLEAVIYPDVPPALLTGCAVGVCILVLAVYGFRFRHRGTEGW